MTLGTRLSAGLLSAVLVFTSLADASAVSRPTSFTSTLLTSQALSAALPFAGNRRLLATTNVKLRGLRLMRGFFRRPEYGVLTGLGVATLVGSVTWALGGPRLVWASDGIPMALFQMMARLFILEGLTLSAAAAGFFSFSGPKTRAKASGGVAPTPFSLWKMALLIGGPGLGVATLSSFTSVVIPYFPADMRPYLMMIVGIYFVFLCSMIGFIRPAVTTSLRDYPWPRMVKNALWTIGVAFLLVAPNVLVHDWSHWVVYNLIRAPAGGIIHWSLTNGDFTPPGAFVFSPLGLLRHVSAHVAEGMFVTAGSVAEWAYGGLLLASSFFWRRRSLPRRAFQLAGVAMFFFSLHYMIVGANFDFFDWQELVKVSPALAKLFMGVALVLTWVGLVGRSRAEALHWRALSVRSAAAFSRAALQPAQASGVPSSPVYPLTLSAQERFDLRSHLGEIAVAADVPAGDLMALVERDLASTDHAGNISLIDSGWAWQPNPVDQRLVQLFWDGVATFFDEPDGRSARAAVAQRQAYHHLFFWDWGQRRLREVRAAVWGSDTVAEAALLAASTAVWGDAGNTAGWTADMLRDWRTQQLLVRMMDHLSTHGSLARFFDPLTPAGLSLTWVERYRRPFERSVRALLQEFTALNRPLSVEERRMFIYEEALLWGPTVRIRQLYNLRANNHALAAST